MADAIDWELIARYLNHTCTAEERRAVVAWAAGDPANAARLDEARRVWEATGELPGSRDIAAGWQRVQARLDAMEAEREQGALRAVGASGSGGRAGGTAVTGWRRVWRGSESATRWTVGAAAAALVLVGVGVTAVLRHVHSPVAVASRAYVTAPGERETVTLPDGTEFTLAPASRVTLAPGYGATRREIALDGEAYFVVIHDPARPFVVRTARAITEDIGTRFAVRAYGTDRAADVVVADGSVSVVGARGGNGSPSGVTSRPAVLTRAMEARVGADGQTVVTRGIDLDAALGWTGGTLVFAGTPLGEAARELSRWYGIEVEVSDPTIAGRPITASFRDERVDDVVRSVAAAVGASVERRGGAIVFVGAGRG